MIDSGWRLPTKLEFELLFFWDTFNRDEEEANRQLIHSHLHDLNLCYWSATVDAYRGKALGVLCSYCLIDSYDQNSLLHVRLVRGKNIQQAAALKTSEQVAERFTLSACKEIMLDCKTGLEWKVYSERAGRFSWHDAVKIFS